MIDCVELWLLPKTITLVHDVLDDYSCLYFVGVGKCVLKPEDVVKGDRNAISNIY